MSQNHLSCSSDRRVIVIPDLPPSINHYYIRNGRRTFVSKDGLVFRSLVSKHILISNISTISKQYRVAATIGFRFSNRRRCDLDNRLKPLLDALMKGGAIDDDSQIDYLSATRLYGQTEETIVVLDTIQTERTQDNANHSRKVSRKRTLNSAV